MFTVQMTLLDDGFTWEAAIRVTAIATGTSDDPDKAIRRATGEAQRITNLMNKETDR